MPQQLLTLSRAARLVGVTRGALQKKIRDSELSTFEGKIAITDLLRAYPAAKLEDDSMLERVTEIKAKARPRRLTQNKSTLPSAEVLASRLICVTEEVSQLRLNLMYHVELVKAITEKLQSLITANETTLKTEVQALMTWFQNELIRKTEISAHSAQLLAKDTFFRIMAATVKVLPSGHEFFVEGVDSILQASLHAGLSLNYGCSSGNCGLCKSRLISGEVRKIQEHDYILSDTEKSMGYILACSNTAVTDIVLEAAEAHSVSEISQQTITSEVNKLESLSPDLLILHVKTPQTKTLRFISGQDVTLSLSETVKGDYAIASCPCDGRYLQFHIRKMPNHPFSDFVFHQLKAEQTIVVEGPKGDFVLQAESTRPIIFIAYEDGFAPIKSLIEHTIALDLAEFMHFYWLATHENGHYLNNLCRSWADALDNFSYNNVMEKEHDTTMLAHTVLTITTEHPQLADYEIYLAGSTKVVDAIKNLLIQQGALIEQLHCKYC